MKTMIEIHISSIRSGDTVLFDGEERTVCSKDIKWDGFMGYSLLGDSYRLGHKLVTKVVYQKP